MKGRIKGSKLLRNCLYFVLGCVFLLNLSFSHSALASPVNGDRRPPPESSDTDPAADQAPIYPLTVSPATANELATAMGVPGGDLLAADLMGSDAAGVGVSDAPLGSWFPTGGSTFAILSTGKAEDAPLANSEPNRSTTLGGLNNDQGNDLVRLHLQLKVPSTMNCASFDFAFYSEEFPEFVGSQFNDTFTAQLNDSTLTTSGNDVMAPGNFAFDTEGNIISINTVFGVNADTGTTYDGATPLLRAKTAVTPDATIDLYLSVQDLGDSIYDSTVFLDRFFWSNDANCEEGAAADTDGDGLLDDWETDGLTVSSGGEDEFVDLPAMGADPMHKDIFIEVDWMGAPSATDTHTHKPKADAIQKIVDAFNNAPVNNPDGTTGIHLHVDYGPDSPLTWGSASTWGALSHGEELTHKKFVSTCSGTSFNWNGVDTIKQDHFTPGRAAVFHYSLWVHDLCTELGGTSGISRNPGGAGFGSGASDFVVSLGEWTSKVGTVGEQAGTFMHELGHNLGLRHGGEDHTQWKPNYLSIMNYLFQTRGLIINNAGGNYDYSRYDLPDLDENNLTESVGIQIPAGVTVTLGTMHFCSLDNIQTTLDASAVDWDCNGNTTGTGLSRNINQGMSWNNNSTKTTLTSQNDWDHLVFSGGAVGQPGADVSLPESTEVIDITVEQNSDIPPSPHPVYLPLLIRK